MATIPREFIRRLVDDADIVGIIGERVALKKRGRNHVGLCPFHSEKTPSFSVHAEKGFYHCFGCGAHGNALDFIVHHNGGDFIAGVESLAAMMGVAIPRAPGEQKANDNAAAFGEVLSAALARFRNHLKEQGRAQEYLKGRGIDGKTAALYQLGYAANARNDLTGALAKKFDNKTLLAAGLTREKDGNYYDYFRDRIMFPVFDRRGHLCGFGGRALDDGDPVKYINSPESPMFAKRALLYGAQIAGKADNANAARKKGRVLITEGYMDVVRLAGLGFAESVATMGTAATVQQMSAALRLANNIVFAFDGDNAGKMAAAKALDGVLPSLRDGDSVRFLFLPDGEDPDSYIGKYGAESFEERISEALSMGDFIEKHLWSEVGNDEGKASAALAAGAKLVRMINTQRAPFLRAIMEKRISARAGLQVQKIKQPVKPTMQTNRAGYRMKSENKVFILLCCLHVKPHLCELLRHSPPLPPEYNEAAADALTIVRGRLLWRDEDGDNDNEQSVVEILREAGFIKLSEQVAQNAMYIYNPKTFGDFADRTVATTIASLQKNYNKRTGKSKRDIWDKYARAADNNDPQQ